MESLLEEDFGHAFSLAPYHCDFETVELYSTPVCLCRKTSRRASRPTRSPPLAHYDRARTNVREQRRSELSARASRSTTVILRAGRSLPLSTRRFVAPARTSRRSKSRDRHRRTLRESSGGWCVWRFKRLETMRSKCNSAMTQWDDICHTGKVVVFVSPKVTDGVRRDAGAERKEPGCQSRFQRGFSAKRPLWPSSR